MMPVIRISDDLYKRLQTHAKPFVDTPADVINRLLDAYETKGDTDTPEDEMEPIEAESVDDEEDGEHTQAAGRTSSGYFFVNVGEDSHMEEKEYRNWSDCIKYGFIAAGWEFYTDQLKKLTRGSKVFAYMRGRGYVGYGEVVRVACPAKEFVPVGHTESVLDLPLQAEDMVHDRDDLDQCEWVVGVKWHTTFSRDEAKRLDGMFAGRHVVCRLRDQKTLDFLRREFNVQPEVPTLFDD